MAVNAVLEMSTSVCDAFIGKADVGIFLKPIPYCIKTLIQRNVMMGPVSSSL